MWIPPSPPHPLILVTDILWLITDFRSVHSRTLPCAMWEGATSRSLSTPSYSGRPAKRWFPEAMTTEPPFSGHTPFLRNLCTISLWTIVTYHSQINNFALLIKCFEPGICWVFLTDWNCYPVELMLDNLLIRASGGVKYDYQIGI